MANMSEAMREIYNAPNSRNKRRGNDKGNYAVYHIWIPGKHRGYRQGYIGVSNLTIEYLFKRYLQEILEADEAQKWRGYVLKSLKQFKGEWEIRLLQEGLTKEEAYREEYRLRPEENSGACYDRFNWNYAAGGERR
jgi:hypothetical protein